MKYEMPALTDNEREKAVRECLKEIRGLKAEMEVNSRFGVPCEPYNTRLICQQIALAALTAEPVAVKYSSGEVLTKEDCLFDERTFAVCCRVETPLYAAPPADKAKDKCRHKFSPNGYGYGFRNFKCSICGKVKTERTECPE